MIPVYLSSSTTGAAITGAAVAASELRVSLDGGAFADSRGVISEVGGVGQGLGAYLYAPSALESVAGRIAVAVNRAGCAAYCYEAVLPVATDFAAGDGPAARLVIVRLTDATTAAGITGIATTTAAGLVVSTAGAAWLAATGAWSAIAGAPDGYYGYTLAPSEVAAGLVMVLAQTGQPFLYETQVAPETVTPVPPSPVPVPVVPGTPAYVDYVSIAVQRLAQQFRSLPTEI